MNRGFGAILIIISIISLIGLIFFVFPLLLAFSHAFSLASEAGYDYILGQGKEFVQNIIFFSYILVVTWLLSAITNLYFGIKIVLKKM